MHEYLRTIGFSSYKTRSDINKLLYMLQRRYVNNAYAIKYDYGEVLYEIRAEVGSGMGVCFIGGVSDIGEFEMDNYYPYVCNNDLSSTEYVDIHKHTIDNLCTGSISDSRVGILIIYRLDNVGQYLDRMYNSIPLRANKSYLAGFSKSAKIIMEIEKTEIEKKNQEKIRRDRCELINAAKRGDETAIESLAMEDMTNYNLVNSRNIREDIYRYIDTSFIPYGFETEIYSILGNIISIETRTNVFTKEEIYDFKIECNDIIMHILINKSDLVGEPKVGRRFKGIVWLTGRVEFCN